MLRRSVTYRWIELSDHNHFCENSYGIEFIFLKCAESKGSLQHILFSPILCINIRFCLLVKSDLNDYMRQQDS